jgi:hypothetical protein
MGIDSKEMETIHWIYPIIGLPQSPLPEGPPGRYILVPEF